MAIDCEDTLAVHLEKLRGILTRLEVSSGERRAALLEQARVAIIEVRQARNVLARNGAVPGCTIDYAASR
jgi:hypothetical protein